MIDVMDDKALEEWMTTIKTEKLTDSDRKLLDNLKNRSVSSSSFKSMLQDFSND